MSDSSEVDVSKCPHCGGILGVLKQALLRQVVEGDVVDAAMVCDSCRKSITRKDILASP